MIDRQSPRRLCERLCDIDRAGVSLKTARRARIHTFIATSDLHLAVKLRMTREQCLDAAVQAVRNSTEPSVNITRREVSLGAGALALTGTGVLVGFSIADSQQPALALLVGHVIAYYASLRG